MMMYSNFNKLKNYNALLQLNVVRDIDLFCIANYFIFVN